MHGALELGAFRFPRPHSLFQEEKEENTAIEFQAVSSRVSSRPRLQRGIMNTGNICLTETYGPIYLIWKLQNPPSGKPVLVKHQKDNTLFENSCKRKK